MARAMDYPFVAFVASFLVLWLSAWLGGAHLGRRLKLQDVVREDFGVILAAALVHRLPSQ